MLWSNSPPLVLYEFQDRSRCHCGLRVTLGSIPTVHLLHFLEQYFACGWKQRQPHGRAADKGFQTWPLPGVGQELP